VFEIDYVERMPAVKDAFTALAIGLVDVHTFILEGKYLHLQAILLIAFLPLQRRQRLQNTEW
jgi:hypothetical protein